MFTLRLSDSVIKSLSTNELNILKYVYEHYREVLEMSIQEFSAQVSYSPATVLRFCKKLGYSGFAELKYVLRSSLQTQKKPPDSPCGSDFTVNMMLDDLYTNMEGTAKLITEENLLKTFRYFDSDCPIYLWAPGGITSILADYFEKLLFSVGRQKVYKIEASRVGEHVLRNTALNGVLILISTSGDYGPTVRLGKLARMKGIPVIAVTPYTNNILADLATVSFRFFVEQRENRGAEFTSRLPVFYILSTIIKCYLEYKQTKSTDSEEEKADDSAL